MPFKNPEDQVLYDEWLANLHVSTAKKYRDKLKTIFEKYTVDELKENFVVIKDISEFNTISIQKTAWSAFNNFAKKYGFYKEEMGKIINPIIIASTQQGIDRKKELPTYQELHQKWEVIDETQFKSLLAKVVLDLYLHYPALRGDVFMIKHKNYQPHEHHLEDNRIVIKSCIKSNRELPDIVLNEQTMAMLKRLLPHLGGDYIIPMNVEGIKRLDNAKPTHILQDYTMTYLGAKLSINDFRKLAVDRVEHDTKFEAPGQRLQKFTALSEAMGHRYVTQQTYYNKGDGVVFENRHITINGDYKCAMNGKYLIIEMSDE
jgi:hypothetical protein